jgi:hypothetical protein
LALLDAQVLNVANAAVGTASMERRQWPRHRLRDATGTLGWSQGDELVNYKMSIIDISGAGAAVLADHGPSSGESVMIQLDSRAIRPQPLAAKVISASSHPSGRIVVRMQFTSWLSLVTVLEQHEERRLWQRYPARETRAALTWFDDDGLHAANCSLSNISGGGAAVFTEEVLPEDRPLRFALDGVPEAGTMIESALVATSVDASGLRVARLKFAEPCPMEVFERAIHGASLLR